MHAFHLATASFLMLTPTGFLSMALGFNSVIAGIVCWAYLSCCALIFTAPSLDTAHYYGRLKCSTRRLLCMDIAMCFLNVLRCVLDAPDVSPINVLTGIMCTSHAIGTIIVLCRSTRASFFKHPIQHTTTSWTTHSAPARLVIGGTGIVLGACAGLVFFSTTLQFALTDTTYNLTVTSVEQLGQTWPFPLASLVLGSFAFAGLSLLLPWQATLVYRYKRRGDKDLTDDDFDLFHYSTTWTGGRAPILMLVGTFLLVICVLTLFLIQTAKSLLVINWATFMGCAITVGSLIVLTSWCCLATHHLPRLDPL